MCSDRWVRRKCDTAQGTKTDPGLAWPLSSGESNTYRSVESKVGGPRAPDSRCPPGEGCIHACVQPKPEADFCSGEVGVAVCGAAASPDFSDGVLQKTARASGSEDVFVEEEEGEGSDDEEEEAQDREVLRMFTTSLCLIALGGGHEHHDEGCIFGGLLKEGEKITYQLLLLLMPRNEPINAFDDILRARPLPRVKICHCASQRDHHPRHGTLFRVRPPPLPRETQHLPL